MAQLFDHLSLADQQQYLAAVSQLLEAMDSSAGQAMSPAEPGAGVPMADPPI